MTQLPPNPPKPGDWMENVQNLANGVHFSLGCLALLITAFFAHRSTKLWTILLGVQVFLVTFVLVKEYVYDLREETGETIKSSTIDAVGWFLGSCFCWLMLALAYKLEIWP